jgi:5-methylcytosine-specific restriction endonuclease McrA
VSWRVEAPPPEPDSFYDTDAWYQLRYRALVLHGGSCQCCGNRANANQPLHVDHIKPRSKFPELELVLDNLQVLCKACNLGKGASDQTDWRPAKKGWRPR